MGPSQPVMLPFPDTKAHEQEIPERPILLATLMSLNPQTHMVRNSLNTLRYTKHTLLIFCMPLFQDQVFTIEAVIVYIDEAKGWYFDKCRTCHMKIEGHPHRHCQQFGTKRTPNYRYT